MRQLVAEPMGAGRTVEEQLSSAPPVGGLWIGVQPLRAAAWEAERSEREAVRSGEMLVSLFAAPNSSRTKSAMGLAPGGRIVQQILAAVRPASDWSEVVAWARIELRSRLSWLEATGQAPPQRARCADPYRGRPAVVHVVGGGGEGALGARCARCVAIASPLGGRRSAGRGSGGAGHRPEPGSGAGRHRGIGRGGVGETPSVMRIW